MLEVNVFLEGKIFLEVFTGGETVGGEKCYFLRFAITGNKTKSLAQILFNCTLFRQQITSAKYTKVNNFQSAGNLVCGTGVLASEK